MRRERKSERALQRARARERERENLRGCGVWQTESKGERARQCHGGGEGGSRGASSHSAACKIKLLPTTCAYYDWLPLLVETGTLARRLRLTCSALLCCQDCQDCHCHCRCCLDRPMLGRPPPTCACCPPPVGRQSEQVTWPTGRRDPPVRRRRRRPPPPIHRRSHCMHTCTHPSVKHAQAVAVAAAARAAANDYAYDDDDDIAPAVFAGDP